MFNKGAYTAIITPFDDNNNVDYDTLCNLIKRQIENCISGIILLGTTGESPTLDIDEKKQIVRTVMYKFNTQIPIIVGGGLENDKDIEEVVEAGASYVVLSTCFESLL